jgi:hypothetical protein
LSFSLIAGTPVRGALAHRWGKTKDKNVKKVKAVREKKHQL